MLSHALGHEFRKNFGKMQVLFNRMILTNEQGKIDISWNQENKKPQPWKKNNETK